MSRDSSTEKPANRSTSSPPIHVVILASGFAGIEVFQNFGKRQYPDLLNITYLKYING